MAAGLDAGRVDAGAVLQQQLHNCRGAHHAEVPVVLDGRAAFVGRVVGVSFNHNVEVGVLFQYFSQRLQRVDTFFRYSPAGGREQQLTLHRYIDLAVARLDVEALVGEAHQGVVQRRAQVFKLLFFGGQCLACVSLLFFKVGLLDAQLIFFGFESLFLGIECSFLLGQFFGACRQQVVGARKVLALTGDALVVVLHNGVEAHLHIHHLEFQLFDAVILTVTDVGKIGYLSAERLVLTLQLCVLVAQVAKLALGGVVVAAQLSVLRLKRLVFA